MELQEVAAHQVWGLRVAAGCAKAESMEALCATAVPPQQELWALGLWEAPGRQRSCKLNMLLAAMEK